MSVKSFRFGCCLVATLLSASAFAEDENQGDLVEKVAVRSRLYDVDGRFELGASVGLSVLQRLTDHYNFNASLAYNVASFLAIELRVGYALGLHTKTASDIAQNFYANSSITTANDVSDLWTMGFNSAIGVRFQPIYGKINLMAELPVHFQLYVWLGGGAAMFNRESIVICNQQAGANCGAFFTEDKVGPVGTAAIGFRFFVTRRNSFKFELRDWSYLDSYYEGVNRAAALDPSNPTGNGTPAASPGLTNLVQFDLGYAFIF